MPAPRNPNTLPATLAVKRRGQETMAAKLRQAGWLVVAPEVLARQPIYICDAIEDIDERPVIDMGTVEKVSGENKMIVLLYPDEMRSGRYHAGS